MPAADEAPPEEEAPLLGGPKMLVLMLAVFVATQGADTIKMAIGALPDAPLATKDVLSVGGKVHISYCTSWSYGTEYMQVKQALEQKNTGIVVIGTNFPPAPRVAVAAKAVGFMSMAVIGTTLVGDSIFNTLGRPVPGIVTSMQGNKAATCMSAFYLGRILSQNLLATGAFEVYFDGEEVFSELRTGEQPNLASVTATVNALIQDRAQQQQKAVPAGSEAVSGSPPVLPGSAGGERAPAPAGQGTAKAAPKDLDEVAEEERTELR